MAITEEARVESPVGTTLEGKAESAELSTWLATTTGISKFLCLLHTPMCRGTLFKLKQHTFINVPCMTYMK